jgi:hypothetical protein
MIIFETGVSQHSPALRVNVSGALRFPRHPPQIWEEGTVGREYNLTAPSVPSLRYRPRSGQHSRMSAYEKASILREERAGC